MVGDQNDGGKGGATPGPAGDRRSVLQNALGAIERLQSRLDATEAAGREPIAIVGMGCRIPGGVVDARSYWELLTAGRDVVGVVPPDRWDVEAYYDPDPSVLGKARTKAGGFLDDLAGFEPAFFGMSPREATGLDPQQRLLLEVAWEALEDAAIPADTLDGSLTGVFVGITSMDYSQRIDVADPARSDIYLATGTALNAAAGRVSFTLGLQGPCMAIDTACSSSLVAIHTACQSLRNRESNLVLAGGVNAIMSPEPFVLISKWGMLSPDGRCKTFDASANGFVRGEGCGLIVLERLSDAIANGRNVLAVIRGSSINQDGHSSGLTVPNGLAQQAVVRQALVAANLKPTDVSYVEAHGTGTSLGDPIEVEALAAVYGQGRDAAEPFEIGSVKSNVGHLEAASGVTGLIKVVLSMQHRQIPASLHVKQPTPAIPWERLPVRISTSLHDWQPAGGTRRAGVSAFGFSGMNAHVILEEAAAAAPAAATTAAAAATARSAHLLPLSARSEAALAALATRLADHLQRQPELALADVCATLAQGRSHFNHRLALIAADTAGMAAQLRAAAAGEGTAVRGQAAVGVRLRVAFLFTGQGSQYVGMGRELDATEPVFRATLDRCAAVLDPLLPRSLRDVLFADTGGLLDQTACTQPALFALEVALAALWRSWGVEPSVVVGHSVGEFAAAVVAGVLSLEDAARLIAARGRLMQALPAGGVMVAVQGDAAVVERAVAPHAARVSIAARNAPGNLVIAGAREPVEAIAAALSAQGLRTQALTVSHAFHSPLMEPMLAEFRSIAAAVTHAAPTLGWISNLDGAAIDWSVWGARMADYWCQHVRAPVASEAGMQALAKANCDACIEIGPSPTLIGLGQQCMGDAQRPVWLPSLKRNRSATEQLLDSVARLYGRGARLDWRALGDPAARHSLRLPTYPFQRQHFMMPPRQPSRRVAGKAVHELLGARIGVAGVAAQFERVISATEPAWLADHRIGGNVLMPFTAYLEAALAAARQVQGSVVTGLDQVEVADPLVLSEGEQRLLQVVVDTGPAGARVRVFSRDAAQEGAPWKLHASATPATTPASALPPLAGAQARCVQAVEVAPLYERLRGIGVDFGDGFRAMRTVRSGVGEAVGEIRLNDGMQSDAGKFLLHPALLDACLHVSAVAMDSLPGGDDGYMYLPISVDHYRWYAAPEAGLRSHARVREAQAGADMRLVDVSIENADGTLVAQLEGVRCRRASRDMFRQRVDAQVADWLYTVAWQEQPIAADHAVAGQWLVFDEGEGRGARLAAEIVRRGGTALRIVPGAGFSVQADDLVQIDPTAAADLTRLLAHAAGQGALAGVVSLWPLRVPALGDDDVPSAGQRFGTDAALLLVQALAAAPAPLWLVTSGTEVVDGCETPHIEQSPVAGFARVAALEHPELQVRHVDLDPQSPAADCRQLADELALSADGAASEHRVALRKGVRQVARLARLPRPTAPPVDEAPNRLHIGSRGTLENLAIVATERRPPGPGEIEIRVRASGLNFRDVLSALGLYPGEIRLLGSDCAGEIVALGSEVKGFQVGDRVVAMAEGAFASHATTRWEFVAPLPAGLDFELGAAIPTAYLTADITLNQIAGMKRGDRVLIHSGAGGVGMAAIALARRVGAEIFATAGNPDKRAVLARLGVHHVLDSRTPAFADEIVRITGGAGVNIVLNSLTGAMLDRSFEVLARDGVFLEIGKRNLWTHEQAEQLGRGIRYHIVDCNDNAQDTPQIVGQIFSRVLREIESGLLPLLPCTTFAFERAPDAFRYMAQARHIGRVVFRHPVVAARVEQPVRGDASYLVTGGLKGLGLLAAQWLVDEGARHLLLAGRGAPDATAQAALAAMAAAGAQVRTLAADVSTAAGVATLMAALADGPAPLGGVLHCAGVLDDGVLVRQTRERFAAVLAPKADGAWRLDRALRKAGLRPDFVVFYSSMSAVLGSPGQGNYVAANAFLDALARRRVVDDQATTCIDWGAWKDVGMAARGHTVERAAAQGLQSLSPQQGMQALGLLLRDGSSHAAVATIDWPVLVRQFGEGAPPALLHGLVVQARSQAGAAGTGASAGPAQRTDYAGLPAAERLPQVTALVRRELATVLALPDGTGSIVDDQPFSSIGLDSLTAVELRNRLQVALGRPVAATAAFEWPTVATLAAQLSSLFGQADAVEGDASREEVTL